MKVRSLMLVMSCIGQTVGGDRQGENVIIPPVNWPDSHRPWSSFVAIELAIEPGPCSSLTRKRRRAAGLGQTRKRAASNFKIPLSLRLVELSPRPRMAPRLSPHVSHVSTHLKNLKLSTPPPPPISPPLHLALERINKLLIQEQSWSNLLRSVSISPVTLSRSTSTSLSSSFIPTISPALTNCVSIYSVACNSNSEYPCDTACGFATPDLPSDICDSS